MASPFPILFLRLAPLNGDQSDHISILALTSRILLPVGCFSFNFLFGLEPVFHVISTAWREDLRISRRTSVRLAMQGPEPSQMSLKRTSDLIAGVRYPWLTGQKRKRENQLSS